MTNKITTAMVAAAMAVFAAQACAQQTGISSDGRPERMTAILLHTGLNNTDAKFLQNMYLGNAFEIQTSQIAENRAQSDWAKEFAKEMVSDHEAAQAELKEIAAKKGLSLDNDLPRMMRTAIFRLREASASNFDTTYRNIMMSSHSDATRILKREIERGHDMDVRDYAVKGLPTVKLHSKLAMNHQTQMGSTAATHGQ